MLPAHATSGRKRVDVGHENSSAPRPISQSSNALAPANLNGSDFAALLPTCFHIGTPLGKIWRRQ